MSDELFGPMSLLGKFDGFTHEQIFRWVEDGAHADPAFVLLEIMIHKEVIRMVAQNREALQLMLKMYKTLDEILQQLKDAK